MIEPAPPEDELAVRRLLDAANLAVEGLPDRLAAGDVLVAHEEGRILGAIVLAPERRAAGSGRPGDAGASGPTKADPSDRPEVDAAHVTAIAVRRRRRDQGIGTALVEAAADRHGALTADFDPRVEPFWRSLGFDIETGDDGRLRGRRD